MKTIFKYRLFLLIILFAVGCNSTPRYQYAEGDVMDMVAAEPAVGYGAKESSISDPTALPVDKKIIRTGSISFESTNLLKSKDFIQQLLKQKNAYIESEDANAGATYSSISFTIRIPATDFDDFLTLLEKGNDKIVSKNIQANDVTAQYVDVESRIKTKRLYLDRYQKLVATAKSTKELLEIEEQIRTIQEELDSYESTFKLLNSQISYSTLTITFSNQQDRITSGPGFLTQLKNAFADSWNVLQNLFLGFIRFLPIIILIVLAIVVIRKIRIKRFFRRKEDL